MARIKNLRGPIARIAMVQMIEYLHFGGKLEKNRLSIHSSIVNHDVGYHLAGAIFLPSNYLDAMPSFPVFLEYWPCVWGTVEDFKEKTFVFNPNFVEEIVCMSDESFGELVNEILEPVDLHRSETNRPFGRGMQKRNFDSELKSLNDRPSNQASICKATSSPKLNGVF